jgi:hypothetical protein
MKRKAARHEAIAVAARAPMAETLEMARQNSVAPPRQGDICRQVHAKAKAR